MTPDELKGRTKLFAVEVIKFSRTLATDPVTAHFAKQLVRSGTSVGANYREAHRARSKAEFISKIGDCLKEADETLYWLELILEESFIPGRRLQPLLNEANELVAILTTISKRAKGVE